jgi:cobalt-zinc-cadmium efflux system protein
MNQTTTHHHQMPQKAHYASAFKWGIALNLVYVVLEFLAGYVFDSLALVADAAHNLSDVAALALAWLAYVLSQRAPTRHKTYGWGKATILVSLFNSLTLMFLVVGIMGAASYRLFGLVQNEPHSMVMVIVASVGVVVNGITAYLLRHQPHLAHAHGAGCAHNTKPHDLNVRVAYVHMLADMLVSVGVVLAGIVLAYTQWLWLDPVVSMAIALVIAATTWPLLVSSWRLALDAVPPHIQVNAVRTYLENLTGVVSVHDLHIWPLSTSQVALTVHLVRCKQHIDDLFTFTTAQSLRDNFDIDHSTIQIEYRQGLHLEEMEQTP